MSFRARLTVLAAVAIAVTVAAISLVLWVVAKHQLRGQVDDALREAAAQVKFGRRGPFDGPFRGGGAVQFLDASGNVIRDIGLPVDDRVRAVARGADGFYTDEDVEGYHLRVLTIPLQEGGAAQLERPLTDTDNALHRIGLAIFLVGGSGVALAAALAAAVATAALRPVKRLTQAAEHVAGTRDLSARIDTSGADELARLATSFNAMLAALEESAGAQRRLVADASHELRTPLTSLRTNLELLAEGRLPDAEREAALGDAIGQIGELTALVGDLVELARGQERRLQTEEVRLDELAATVVERARPRWPGVRFETSFEPTVVNGDAPLLESAVANLVDNAAKYSPEGGVVEVVASGGEVSVRDHGPGISEADLPFVFDRFYRAPTARSKPGSGLGLAIVRQAAEAHGGRATAEGSSPGARFRLILPAAELNGPEGDGAVRQDAPPPRSDLRAT